VNGVRTGPSGKLFHPDQLISGKEDAANNFARGHYTTGKELIEPILDNVRKLTESCNSLQGFMMFNSVAGGTGGGLGSLMLEKLSEEYGKKAKIGFSIFPSPEISTSLVESYNAVLSTHTLLDHTDISVVFDNQALYDIARTKLGIQQPTYKNLNTIISQVISSLTTSLRFDGELNVDISEFQTNLVPYPRIHFMLSSLAPIVTSKNIIHEQLSVSDITNDVIESKSMMAKCDPRDGKYMAACLMYRGNVQSQEVNQSVNFIKKKKKMDFVDWSPCGLIYLFLTNRIQMGN
jgi:tubulin alpha